ncbi:hypothetical protein, partial [Gluconobacter kondonii]|uniref:hypothetical protein n=1 Tax=Gluconobacter kondonii TaxID=941463 RepID=UPI001B8C1A2E
GRVGQYHLQHAPLPLPRKIERERVVIQRDAVLDLLKTQSENQEKRALINSSAIPPRERPPDGGYS